MTTLTLQVVEARMETPTVRRIDLVAADGGPLPSYEPGAHITVHVPGVGKRKYSLINTEAAPTQAPARYTLGVRLDAAGQGGSRWMHGLDAGSQLRAEPPDNDFALAEGTGPVVLIAGGIGITPLLSKAASMKLAGRPFRLVYAARTPEDFAFLREVKALAGDHLMLHADSAEGRLLDIPSIMAQLVHDEPVYICGPKPMIKAALQAARAAGWPEGRLRFELFYSPAAETGQANEAGAGGFEVVLKSTGQSFTVPPDKTILAVLLEAGVDPLHDCDKGECGVCQVGLLEGIADHRDTILSESERTAGKLIQICVSRAKSPRLVLDL